EFGEDLLDWVEVGRVGRQEEAPCPGSSDSRADSLALVRAEIVHDDDVAGFQRRHQGLLDVGPEGLPIDRPIDEAGRLDPVDAQRREEGQRPPMAMRHLAPEALAARRPAPEGAHVRLGPGLIDEDETGGIDLRLMASPPRAAARDVRAILLARE